MLEFVGRCVGWRNPAWLTNGMLWNCTLLLKILPPRGSQKVCYLGMAPSCSKFKPRVACKRYATLAWELPALNVILAWPTEGVLWYSTFLL